MKAFNLERALAGDPVVINKIKFKIIKEFPKYLIGIDGSIFSLYTKRILKHHLHRDGYPQIILCKDGKHFTKQIHRLVAKTFIKNKNNYPCVNHIDGNKLNNNIFNLEWCSYSQNTKHAISLGLIKNTLKQRKSASILCKKRNPKKVINIKTGKIYESCKSAAKSIKMDIRYLSRKLLGHRKNDTNFKYL